MCSRPGIKVADHSIDGIRRPWRRVPGEVHDRWVYLSEGSAQPLALWLSWPLGYDFVQEGLDGEVEVAICVEEIVGGLGQAKDRKLRCQATSGADEGTSALPWASSVAPLRSADTLTVQSSTKTSRKMTSPSTVHQITCSDSASSTERAGPPRTASKSRPCWAILWVSSSEPLKLSVL